MRRARNSYLSVLVCALLSSTANAIQTDSQNETLSFSSEIRPILSKHCYACHGPDEHTREADLRLDIANEDVDFESLLERIQSDDEDEIMPPPDHNKPLGDQKIKQLGTWIDQGAKYEEHWAFVLPSKPEVSGDAHPVDFFVDRQLAKNELRRSAKTDPATLIRRVYLDLIGLPPTIAQAEVFIEDPTQATFEKMVDQLLASPRYGERWARRWLDLARYADTGGFEKDRDRSIWPYRDWVIRSINSGLPFDQFTIQQIAGDMLPSATVQQVVATGFHRNTMLNEEGGIDPLEYRFYSMVDRVGTTGATWLGLTTACAQCHTHKFDPITHEDYFGLMAYMDNADEPDFHLPVDDVNAKRENNLKEAKQLLDALPQKWPKQDDKYDGPTFDEAFAAWLKQQEKSVTEWQTLTANSAKANLPHLTLDAGGVIFATGDTTKHDTYTLSFSGHQTPVTAIRLETLPDPRLPGFGPGLTYYEGNKGDFFLAEIRVETETGELSKWGKATHTHANNQFGNHPVSAKLATDGDVESGWCVADRTGERHVAVFNLAEPLPARTPFKITMEFGRHFASSLGKFRLSVADATSELLATTLSDEQLETVNRKDDSKDTLKEDELRFAFAMEAKQLSKHAKRVRQLQRPVVGNATLVFRERSAGQRRKTYLRHRGEFTQPKQQITPRLPDAIVKGEAGSIPTDRLEFARWLVSRENPLTARVVANRQWTAFFGTGLVATVDDFGMQGDAPSHPELLDYLAVEFMDQGWSMKKLHRLIVTSQTYQQSSTVDPGHEHPRAERLLGRFPRRRLEAEIIRDTSLFVAGLLDEKMYGKPVRPPQPEGAAANYSKSKWKASSGTDRFRRSVYTYQKRTAPFAMFTTFDAGSGEFCLARRDVSNTPLQALTMMNDPMFVEIAEAYGKRMNAVEGDAKTKITTAFGWLLARPPEVDEFEMLSAFYEKHQSWSALARVLLCLDESITKN